MAHEPVRRWNIGRDMVGGALLCAALVLPWNIFFGVGIPGTRAAVFAVLALATMLSLGSVIVTHLGHWRISGAHFDPALTGRLRLGLNVPYLLLVFGFTVFDVIQTVRYGGGTRVPGGLGPGAWLGAAGALLTAQPVITGSAAENDAPGRWLRSARVLGYASIAGAGLSALFNFYWRIRYALPNSGAGAGFGRQHVALIATALVYGAVAWVTVLVASRWILQRNSVSRVAITALGASTLIAGLVVWWLPIGRNIDGFHGIAQNTSTAGVGFEGYLAWVAAAAIFAVPALRSPLATRGDVWLAATRKLLLLIVIWCTGSLIMRVTDVIVAAALGLAYSPYDTAAIAAFDAITAMLAVWLRVNLVNRALPSPAIWSMGAVLFGFTVSRLVVGIGLAPRLPDSQRLPANPVYGNDLAQQITSTFDVVLCGLALCGVAVTIVATRLKPARRPSRPPAPRIFRSEHPTRAMSAKTPRIYRTADDSAPRGRHEA